MLKREPNNIRAQILRNSIAGKIDLNESIGDIGAASISNLACSAYFSWPVLKTQQDPLNAEEIFKKAVDQDKRSIDARLALANFNLLSKRLSEAEQQYRAALEIDPRSRDANLSFAFFCAQNNRQPEAELIYTDLKNQNPKEPLFAILLADFYASMGKVDKAIEISQQTLSADPKLLVVQAAITMSRDLDKLHKAPTKSLSRAVTPGLPDKGKILLSQQDSGGNSATRTA